MNSGKTMAPHWFGGSLRIEISIAFTIIGVGLLVLHRLGVFE